MLQEDVDKERRYIRMMQQVNAAKTSSGPNMKFGIEVPKNYKDAMRLDLVNGNTLWQDAIKTKLDQINSYSTFVDHGKKHPTSKGLQESTCTLCI